MEWPTTQFRAMGGEVRLWLEAPPARAERAFARARAAIEEAEEVLSRFRPQSELCRLNERAGQWVEVSPLMWQVVSRALALARLTGGLFDPTILPALEAAGYTVTFEEVGVGGMGEPRRREGREEGKGGKRGRWRQVALDGRRRAIWLAEGARLDLGGVAKGMIAAQVAQMLGREGPALVDAGGDLVATDAPRGWPGWPVAVAAPSAEDEAENDLLQLWLARATLATSGVDYRRWRTGDSASEAHHLIDPRTGLPAAGEVLTATVLAADAAVAEAWATAALVAGREEGVRLLAAQGLAAVLVDNDDEVWLTPRMEAWLRL